MILAYRLDKLDELEKPTPLKEGEDYYFDENGLMVFTAAYHLKRGHCCDNGCRHCPYKKPKG